VFDSAFDVIVSQMGLKEQYSVDLTNFVTAVVVQFALDLMKANLCLRCLVPQMLKVMANLILHSFVKRVIPDADLTNLLENETNIGFEFGHWNEFFHQPDLKWKPDLKDLTRRLMMIALEDC
jgi:hypothetical protein